VSFDIRRGEILAIIGPNGAGKTSMLNIINGFYQPQQGRIAFKGRTRTAMRPYEAASGGIARTFQNVALFRGMTVLDNIMAGRTLKMSRGLLWQMLRFGPALAEEVAHRRRAEDIIDFLEIPHIRKVPVGRLPYGLQKRVELARALAMEPDLLLLDEPMAGMNLEEKEDMSRYILDVSQEMGTTIVLIEHDMGVVMDLSDRVGARSWHQDRRRHAGRGQAKPSVIVDAIWASHINREHSVVSFGQFLEVLIKAVYWRACSIRL
jgi:branched-chain amino acid transport system ATP-binding protein